MAQGLHHVALVLRVSTVAQQVRHARFALLVIIRQMELLFVQHVPPVNTILRLE